MSKVTGIYECPSCKQNLSFAYRNTNYITCKSCKTTVYRDEADNVIAQKETLISNPYEPIQPGTKGKWEGKEFTVTGRMQMWLEETVYNYWTIIYKDGTLGLLAEGYGQFTLLSKKVFPPITSKKLDTFKVGKNNKNDNIGALFLERKYNCKYWEIEGEIYVPSWKLNISIFELTTSEVEYIEIHEYLNDYVVVYDAIPVSFDDLNLSNLRPVQYSNKQNTCKYCNTVQYIKTWPYSQSIGCIGCKTRYELKKGDEYIVRGTNEVEASFDIPIGKSGVLNDIEYTVLGYVLKKDNSQYESQWKEYTLHNPLHGYVFLSEYNGHWIFVKEANNTPAILNSQDRTFTYNNQLFQLYNMYSFKVLDSKGEFPNNIFNDNYTIKVQESICPPTMWIKETSSNEGVNWYHAEHIAKRDVEKAFDVSLPYQTGKGVLNSNGYIEPYKIVGTTIAAIVVCIIIHIFMASSMLKKTVLDANYFMPDSSNTLNIVTEKFQLTKYKSNLQFNIYAPVDNSWFELNINLVNSKTGDEFSLEKGVEYYSGYSDGESWSEGNPRDDAYLSSIPAGTYFLQLTASGDPNKHISNFELKVVNDTPMEHNLLIVCSLLLIWPLILGISNYYSERARWKDSDYSPYAYE